MQAQLMAQLHAEGHARLRLGYEPFMALIGAAGARPGELASQLCVSKQACNQTINQIARAGYLARRPDPDDGRATLLVLTAAGRRLRQRGGELTAAYEVRCGELIGADSMQELLVLLRQLHLALELPTPPIAANSAPRPGELGVRMPRIADYMTRRLMQLTIARGHPGLKLAFGQVLSLIGLEGGRISKMARVQQVSKQAISVVAAELEQLGYIYREPDPGDARQHVLRFTDSGLQLLEDSVASVAELERELAALVGTGALEIIQRALQDLYQGLRLEEEIFGARQLVATPDLAVLAAQLLKQLGSENAARLAAMLTSQREVSYEL